jgi:import inner membrane translocase subunit TIM17
MSFQQDVQWVPSGILLKGSSYKVRRERKKGGLVSLRRAPIFGGSFAMWACVFSISNCFMVYLRQREDPINSIIAGFTTGFMHLEVQ